MKGLNPAVISKVGWVWLSRRMSCCNRRWILVIQSECTQDHLHVCLGSHLFDMILWLPYSLAGVYHILVTLTPQRHLQGVWLLLVDHPSHQVFITCQGHRGETCRLNQPGEKLYKYLNIAIKTFLGFIVKCCSSPTNSWKLHRAVWNPSGSLH